MSRRLRAPPVRRFFIDFKTVFLDNFMVMVYNINTMNFLTETSLYEVSIEGRKLVVRKKGLRKGKSSKVEIGQEFYGDQLAIRQGKVMLFSGGKMVLQTSQIQ